MTMAIPREGLTHRARLVLTASAWLPGRSSTKGGSTNFGDLDATVSSLGEGVDVVKLQVALNCRDRSRSSILGGCPILLDPGAVCPLMRSRSPAPELCLCPCESRPRLCRLDETKRISVLGHSES